MKIINTENMEQYSKECVEKIGFNEQLNCKKNNDKRLKLTEKLLDAAYFLFMIGTIAFIAIMLTRGSKLLALVSVILPLAVHSGLKVYIYCIEYSYLRKKVAVDEKLHLANMLLTYDVIGRTKIDTENSEIGIVFKDRDTMEIDTYYYNFEIKQADSDEEILDLENMVYYYIRQ